MATYIPNITDVFPEPYIYKPDLAFFDKMLQRKTALYEQGVAKTKNAFESVLYAPLSNLENIPIRDAYIKQARENIQKMAGMDFSQAQNVAAARGIFAPFWEDNFIVKDVELTKHYQNQAQILDGWKNNDDPKIRENYNGIVSKYLQNGLDVLVNAKRTDEDFSKIQRRKASPFTNIEKYLQEQADKQDLKIIWDETNPDGGYLIETMNGERSKKPFAIWAQSQIGNNFYEQFNITGTVYSEELYKQYKAKNPNFSDKEIYSLIADDHVKEIENGYSKRRNQVLGEIARIDGIINSLSSVSNANEQEAIKQYANEKAQLYGRLNQIDQEYKLDMTKNYKDQIKNNILTDPNSYFGTLSKQRLVDNWATGRSVITSRELEPNETFFKAQTLQMEKAKYNLDVYKTQFEIEKLKAETEKTQADTQKILQEAQTNNYLKSKGYKLNEKGEIVKIDTGEKVSDAEVSGLVKEATARYIGPGVFDVTKQGTALDVFEKGQRWLFNSGFNSVYDNNGLLHFAKNLGLNDAEIAAVSSYYSSLLNSGLFVPGGSGYNIKNDPKLKDQLAAMDKLNEKLLNSPYVKQANITKLAYGPYAQFNALRAYASGYIEDRIKESKDKGIDFQLTDQEFRSIMSYLTATTNMDLYNANEDNRNKLLNDYAVKNPKEASKYFIKKDDGKYGLMTLEQLSNIPEIKAFSKIGAGIDFNGKPYYLNPKAIAKSIMNGTFKYNLVYSNYGKYGVGPAHDLKYVEITTDYGTHKETSTISKYHADELEGNFLNLAASTVKNLENRIGSVYDFSKNIKKISDNLVPNLKYFSSITGKQGAMFNVSFTTDDKKDNPLAFATLDEALNPTYATMYIRDENGKIEQAKSDFATSIINMFQGKKDKTKQFLESFNYVTVGSKEFDNKPYISLKFGAMEGKSELEIGDTKVRDIAKKGEIILAINDQKGGNLNKLPTNLGMYVYQPLLMGKVIKSDPIMKSLGWDFTLTPNRDGTDDRNPPTSVTLSLSYLERQNKNNDNGEYVSELVPIKKEDVEFPLIGDNAKTPDEIVNYIYSLYRDVMNKNKELQKQYLLVKEKQKNPSKTNVLNSLYLK